MTPEKFEALTAEGYNRIPVSCEILADLDTPLSVYLKLVDGPLWLSCLSLFKVARNGGVIQSLAYLAVSV
jgi:hypothetical protein